MVETAPYGDGGLEERQSVAAASWTAPCCAHALANFAVALTEDPTSGNPPRIKVGGDAGITRALVGA
jgi:hypothetical protein